MTVKRDRKSSFKHFLKWSFNLSLFVIMAPRRKSPHDTMNGVASSDKNNKSTRSGGYDSVISVYCQNILNNR